MIQISSLCYLRVHDKFKPLYGPISKRGTVRFAVNLVCIFPMILPAQGMGILLANCYFTFSRTKSVQTDLGICIQIA